MADGQTADRQTDNNVILYGIRFFIFGVLNTKMYKGSTSSFSIVKKWVVAVKMIYVKDDCNHREAYGKGTQYVCGRTTFELVCHS